MPPRTAQNSTAPGTLLSHRTHNKGPALSGQSKPAAARASVCLFRAIHRQSTEGAQNPSLCRAQQLPRVPRARGDPTPRGKGWRPKPGWKEAPEAAASVLKASKGLAWRGAGVTPGEQGDPPGRRASSGTRRPGSGNPRHAHCEGGSQVRHELQPSKEGDRPGTATRGNPPGAGPRPRRGANAGDGAR